MKPNILKVGFLMLTLLISGTYNMARAQVYFPPNSGNWDTLHPMRLGWCETKLDSLQDYLESKKTKAFMVLKDGKIVLEWYFGTFTQDSLWYWASAGKSLASAVIGIAEQDGYLSLDFPVSAYLGEGWTSCPKDKEDQITVLHQVTMTTGLNENLLNSDCTTPECLTYKADAGTRWFYHNAPYTLTHDVVEKATGKSFNIYTYQRLTSRIGMGGLWVKSGWNDLFLSKARDMARFGVLMLANGIWKQDTVLNNMSYHPAMIQTSQSLNKSYGYLWWLNGKGEIIMPGLPTVFNRDLVPSAPSDMYAAMGKNDQKLYVVPSQGLVVVRMGDAADDAMPALSDFDIVLWSKISDLVCKTGGSKNLSTLSTVYPNPFTGELNLERSEPFNYQLCNNRGAVIKSGFSLGSEHIETTEIPAGFYFLRLISTNQTEWMPLIKTN